MFWGICRSAVLLMVTHKGTSPSLPCSPCSPLATRTARLTSLGTTATWYQYVEYGNLNPGLVILILMLGISILGYILTRCREKRGCQDNETLSVHQENAFASEESLHFPRPRHLKCGIIRLGTTPPIHEEQKAAQRQKGLPISLTSLCPLSLRSANQSQAFQC